MTSIMNRSALEYWGYEIGPDVAYIVRQGSGSRTVTWGDVTRARRDRQKQRLEAIRQTSSSLRPYRLWVAYFDQSLMGGWHAFLDTYRGDRTWVDRDAKPLRVPLMRMFPLGLFSFDELFGTWKVEFAKCYERRRQDGQPVGVSYIWWDGWHTFEKCSSKPRQLPSVLPDAKNGYDAK